MKLKFFLSVFLLSVCLNGMSETPGLTGPYFGQKSPGMDPVIFAPEIVSTGMTESSIAFTPDGKECFWTIHPSGIEFIATSRMVDGKWTKPEIAPFSGKYLDGFPSIHPDGSMMVFHSMRPTGDASKYPAKLNLWMIKRNGIHWGRPELIKSPVNGPGDSGCPSVSAGGTLYFSKKMPDGSELIVRSKLKGNHYGELEILPENVNSSRYNFHACVAPDESYLIIPRYNMDDRIGAESNYYIIFREKNDQWGKYKNLGKKINNARVSITPSVSSDGKYFFFQGKTESKYLDTLGKRFSMAEIRKRELTSPGNNSRNIYWVSTEYLELVKKLEYTTIAAAIQQEIQKNGVREAETLYRELKKNHPDFYDFSEGTINRLGYKNLQAGKPKDAIKVFLLNTYLFPDSWNVYDSLAEGYMKDGQIRLAVLNYEKSLEINRENGNAAEMIKKLKQMK